MLNMCFKIAFIGTVGVKIKEMEAAHTGIKKKAFAATELVVIRKI